MKTFEIEYEGRLRIIAKSYDSARKAFNNLHGDIGWEKNYSEIKDGQTVSSKEVVGHSEISGLAIFEDDEYIVDNEDGIMILKSEDE